MTPFLPVAAIGASDIFVALAVSALLFAAVVIAMPAGSGVQLRKRLAPYIPNDLKPAESRPQRPGLRERLYAATERALGGTGLWKRMVVALERAGSTTPPGKYFCAML